MRPFVALASLAAAASYALAQNANPVAGSSPMSPSPGDKPAHDPSSDFVEQLAGAGAGSAYAHPPSAPQPASAVEGGGQTVFSNGDRGHVEIIGGRSLADTLTLDRRGRVWWDYAREIDSVVRFCSVARGGRILTDALQTSRLLHIGQTTLLVPVDSAIMKLSRKPSVCSLWHDFS